MPEEKKGISIYLLKEKKEEIENFFLDCRIKNFQDGYKEIIDIGFEAFKKNKLKEKRNGI